MRNEKLTTNPHQESVKYEYDVEDYLVQLEASIDVLNLIIEGFYDTQKSTDSALVYITIQTRDHVKALRNAMFPEVKEVA